MLLVPTMSGENLNDLFGDSDDYDIYDVYDPDYILGANVRDIYEDFMKAGSDGSDKKNIIDNGLSSGDKNGDSTDPDKKLEDAKKNAGESAKKSNSFCPPAAKKKKKKGVLKAKPLKPGNAKFAKSDCPNRKELYGASTCQGATFADTAVVCTFRASETLRTFREKLEESKDTFKANAPFPPGVDAKKAKPIFKK